MTTEQATPRTRREVRADERDRVLGGAIAKRLAQRNDHRPTTNELGRAEANLARVMDNPGTHLVLVGAATGLGKTRLAASRVARGQATLFNAATHSLADDFEAMVASLADVDTDRWMGRRALAPDKKTEVHRQLADGKLAEAIPMPVGTCHRMTEVTAVSEQHHWAMPSLCQTCPHGLATMLDRAGRQGNWIKYDDLYAKISKMGQAAENVFRCGYITQPALTRTKSLLTQAGNGTSADQTHAKIDGTDTNRELIVDEVRELITVGYIRPMDVAGWEDRLRGMLVAADEQVNSITSPDSNVAKDITARHKMLTILYNETIPYLTKLREQLLSPAPDDNAIWNALEELARLDKTAQGGAKNVLIMERVRVAWESGDLREFLAPLRAVRNVVAAHKVDVARIVIERTKDSITHAIEFYFASALGEVILERGKKHDPQRRTMILDATPLPGVRTAVATMGGTIHQETIKSPITVVCDPSASVGRGSGEANKQMRTLQAVNLIRRSIKTLADALKCQPDEIAVLTHKPWALAAISAGVQALEIGWWFRHDTGHNRWKEARGLLIVGAPYLPPTEERKAYHQDRALALMAGAEASEWPWWDDNAPMEIRTTVNVGGVGIAWPALLPVDDHLQKWVLGRMAGRYVQALGRPRPIRSKTQQAVLILGPCPDLSEHGIMVQPVTGISPLHVLPTAADRGEARMAEANLRIATAMCKLGAKAPNKAIISWLKQITGKGAHPRVIARVRTEIRELGITVEEYRRRQAQAVATARRDGVIHTLRDDLPRSARQIIDTYARSLWHRTQDIPVQRRITGATPRDHAPPAA